MVRPARVLDSIQKKVDYNIPPPATREYCVATSYRRKETVEAAPMERETILYHPDANQFCVLNGTAAFLWERLEKPNTATELSTALCAGFEGVAAEQAERDVRMALERFQGLALIVASE